MGRGIKGCRRCSWGQGEEGLGNLATSNSSCRARVHLQLLLQVNQHEQKKLFNPVHFSVLTKEQLKKIVNTGDHSTYQSVKIKAAIQKKCVWIVTPILRNLENLSQQNEKERKKCVVSHMSCATCHVSNVACHLSLTPTATATDPHPANSPSMHSRLVCKDPKKSQDKNHSVFHKTNCLRQKSSLHQEAWVPPTNEPFSVFKPYDYGL